MRCDPPALYTDHYSAGVIQAPTTEHIVYRIGFDCGWGLKLISSLLIWLWASCWAVAGWLVGWLTANWNELNSLHLHGICVPPAINAHTVKGE